MECDVITPLATPVTAGGFLAEQLHRRLHFTFAYDRALTIMVAAFCAASMAATLSDSAASARASASAARCRAACSPAFAAVSATLALRWHATALAGTHLEDSLCLGRTIANGLVPGKASSEYR